jgi:hypothetical protein
MGLDGGGHGQAQTSPLIHDRIPEEERSVREKGSDVWAVKDLEFVIPQFHGIKTIPPNWVTRPPPSLPLPQEEYVTD